MNVSLLQICAVRRLRLPVRSRLGRPLILMMAALCWSGTAGAQNSAKVLSAQGSVERDQPREPLSVNTWLTVGTTVRTGEQSRAVLLMVDETQLKLNSNTQLQLTAAREASTVFRRVALAANRSQESVLNVSRGQVWLRARNTPTNVKVTTPAVTAAVRGTEFDLTVGPNGESVITVLEGSVDFRNDIGAIMVNTGEQGRAQVGQAPTKTVLLNPTDAVQWTLNYTNAASSRDYPAGAPAAARVLVQQAQVNLLSGDAVAARAVLEEVAAADPAYAPAQALLSNVHLVQNRNDEARAAAERAISANPEAPSAYLALSLVEQSAFHLPAATRAAEHARALDPTFAQANVQYAILLFGAGDTGKAETVVRQVVASAPQDAIAHSTLGFVLLARGRLGDARTALARSLALDSAQGEPHLGLGILAMREGKHEDAVGEFLEAATIEPRRSLYQTYLAKALYELRRFDQAFAALASAERLDPLDPTPHLYAGIFNNDLNRPGAAVAEFEQSIRLNDDRAVYRSRFLLDQDQATRNVKLATAYDLLGLTEWANSHAVKSELFDSSNSGAHQFLADTFLNLDGRLSAGGGELLLGRLLMPANANSFNAFNDYTTLFDRPRINGSITGTAGSFNARAGSVNSSGGTDRLAYSTFWDYSRTDGFRPVNDDRHDATGAVLTKFALTPHSDVLFSYVHLNSHQGDHGGGLSSLVGDTGNNPYRRVTALLDRVEVGFHQQLRPGSDVVAFFSRETDTVVADDPRARNGLLHTIFTSHAPYFSYQAAHLLKVAKVQFRYGVDIFQGQQEQTTDTRFNLSLDPPQEFPISIDATRNEVRFRTAFVQSSYAVTSTLAVTAGVNYDWSNHDDLFLKSPQSSSQWDPNVGVLYSVTPSTTLRFAMMRVLQTDYQDRLAPTHVVGFPLTQNENQLTSSTAYNMGWDQRLGTRALLRTSAFTRDSRVALDASFCEVVNCTGRFHGGAIVVNTFLTNRWTFVPRYSIKYATDLFGVRQDHEGILGMVYVHPAGWAFSARQHYFRQRGQTQGSPTETSVFTTNATFSYNLPSRRGQISLIANNITDQRYVFLADPLSLDSRVPRRQLSVIMRVNF